MGAHDFTTYAFGKDATDAYRAACEAAIRENGHRDGYNGTISTTTGAVLVEVPKGIKAETMVSLLWLAHDAFGEEPTAPARLKTGSDEWARRAHAETKKVWAKWTTLSRTDQVAILNAGRTIQKWQDCVVFRLPAAEERRYRQAHGLLNKHGAVFCFTGIAAC